MFHFFQLVMTMLHIESDTSAYDWQNKAGETNVELGSSTKSLVKELIDRKVITTNKVVDITSGKLGENEYAKDGTIHGDIYFSLVQQ